MPYTTLRNMHLSVFLWSQSTVKEYQYNTAAKHHGNVQNIATDSRCQPIRGVILMEVNPVQARPTGPSTLETVAYFC